MDYRMQHGHRFVPATMRLTTATVLAALLAAAGCVAPGARVAGQALNTTSATIIPPPCDGFDCDR